MPAEIKARTASTDANPLFHRAPLAPQPARVRALPSLPLPPEPIRAYEPSLFQRGSEAGSAARAARCRLTCVGTEAAGEQRAQHRAGSGPGRAGQP